MSFVKGFDCLDLDHNTILYQQVSKKLAYYNTIVPDLDRMLLQHLQACFLISKANAFS